MSNLGKNTVFLGLLRGAFHDKRSLLRKRREIGMKKARGNRANVVTKSRESLLLTAVLKPS